MYQNKIKTIGLWSELTKQYHKQFTLCSKIKSNKIETFWAVIKRNIKMAKKFTLETWSLPLEPCMPGCNDFFVPFFNFYGCSPISSWIRSPRAKKLF